MTTKKNLSAGSQQRTSESLLKDIRRNTKRIFTSEQKVLIVMEGIVVNRVSQSSAGSMVYPIVLTTNVCLARWKVRFFLTPQRSAISFKYALVF